MGVMARTGQEDLDRLAGRAERVIEALRTRV